MLVCCFDPAGDCEHGGVRIWILPLLKVVSVEPDDVWELLVPVAEPLSEQVILGDAVLPKDIEPTTSLNRIQEYGQPVACGHSDHCIGTMEILLVRLGEIAWCRERSDLVECRSVRSPTGVPVAQQVDPYRV